VRNDANKDARQAEITTAGENRRKKVNLHCINQIEVSDTHNPQAAQALGILRGDIWVEEIGEGLTELKVRLRQPAVEHRVRMKNFRRWLESQGKTPAECTRKRKLLALAKGGGRER